MLMDKVYKVVLVVSKRGWGPNIFDVFYYDSIEDALKKVEEVNSHNKFTTAPD